MSSFPKPHHLEKPIEELEIFELLAIAIPRGESDNIGKLCGCSGQTVRSWRNDPDTDENRAADANGRRSPLAYLLQFLDALDARHPEGADMIVDRIIYEHAARHSIRGRKAKLRLWQRLRKAHELARELAAITDLDGEIDGQTPT